MPATLLIPHNKLLATKNQISFVQIARSIVFLSLLGHQKVSAKLQSVIKEQDFRVNKSSIQLLTCCDPKKMATVQMYEKSLKLKNSDRNSKPSTSLKKKMGMAD